jgi:hypothetical protein
MAALELVTSVHEVAPDPPILLATASADGVGADTLITAGVKDVVPRSVVASDIGSALVACSAAKWSAGTAPFSSGHDTRGSLVREGRL